MPGKSSGLLQQIADPSQPWEKIAIDFIVELPESGGNTVIWTVMDVFSKQPTSLHALVSPQLRGYQRCSCNTLTDCTECPSASSQIEGSSSWLGFGVIL